MRSPLRLLACADHRIAASMETALEESQVVRLIGRAACGGEMLAQFRALAPDMVVIAGDIDGCYGVRVAGALARQRQVPTLLLVDPGAEAEAQDELERRGVQAEVLSRSSLETDGGAAVTQATLRLFAARVQETPTPHDGIRSEIGALAQLPFDVVVLLGSAGTPHLLPRLLHPRRQSQIPLIIAVHHNPRLSEAFCRWVGELADVEPQPYRGGAAARRRCRSCPRRRAGT